jgi:PAS domain S-box-containing protein
MNMQQRSGENKNNFIEQHFPSAAQLQWLFHSSLDLICSIDAGGHFVHVSDACRKLLGYGPEELSGQCLTQFLHLDDVEKTVSVRDALVRSEKISNFENRCRRKDSTFVIVSWSFHWDEKEALLFCIGRDVTEKKEKDVMQRHFKQKFKEQNWQTLQILERITDAFFALDGEWRVSYANAQCGRMLNLNVEDYLSRNLWEAFPSLVGTIFYEQYHKAVQQKVAVQFEAYLPLFESWYEVHAYPSESGLSVFFRDITERMKAEEKRRQTEEELRRLSLVAKETADAVSIVETDGRISWVNDAFTKLFGYTFEEAVGGRHSELLRGPDSDLQTEREMKRCFAEGQPFKGEILAYTKSGETRWLNATGQPLLDQEGKVEGFFIIQTDVTRRKHKKELIRKLSTYMQKTKDLVVVVDTDCRINWVNEAFEKTSGYTFAEVSGLKCNELLQGPGTDPKTAAYIKSCMERAEPFQAEILNYPKQGKPYWLEIYGQPFFDDNGKVTEFFTIQRNITERRRLQHQLEDEVKRRHREVTAAVVNTQERERAEVGRELHDNVNQILTSVKLYQELVLSGFGNQEELVRKSIDLLLQAINENRRLSKQLSATTLAKGALVETVRELVDTFAAAQKFELSLQITALHDFHASEGLHLAIYRILQEHLTNVSRYAAASKVQVTIAKQESFLVLNITDDGCGFDSTKKRSGIGITNMIIRAEHLNGTLNIDSAPGKGCTLSASFPLTE